MRIQELRQKSKQELQTMLQDSREKLRQLRFNLSLGKLKNVKEIQHTKKIVAYILTILKSHG
ncbi:MAG: 50S ribosomal protein L29 [Candidatus Wildermuthbacteria bacterium]|nr:50S ribosomal protein L29 [Candidatus Wildermuthbacteria bacterium]